MDPVKVFRDVISQDNDTLLREFIDKSNINFMIRNLDYDEADDLFLLILPTVIETNNNEITKILTELWNSSFYENRSYLSYLFEVPKITDEQLTYLISANDAIVDEIMDQLIEGDDTDLTYYSITRCLRLFNVTDLSNIDEFKKTAVNFQNFKAEEAINDYSIKLRPFISKPSHVRNVLDLEPLPTDLELNLTLPPIDPDYKQIDLPSDEEIVDLKMSNMVYEGLTYKEEDESFIRQELLRAIDKMSYDEKRSYYLPIMFNLEQRSKKWDDGIFITLGAVNPILGEDYSNTEIPCGKYGGCRMLTCTHFVRSDDVDLDDNEEMNLDPTSWFTGSCQICSNRIPYWWWSVRLPIRFGGWFGCYCSWDCVRLDPRITDTIMSNLITFYKNSTDLKGIQDRTPPI